MQFRRGKIFLTFVLLMGVAACDVPKGAGETRQILAGANAEDATFSVHYITRETLPQLTSWPTRGIPGFRGWIKNSPGPSGQIIAPGDKIDLSIWDNEDSSLLTPPGQKAVTLPGMIVSERGTIFLPYLDEVYVAKMSPDRARAAIQEKMQTIIPSAQVQLALVTGLQSSVDLISGVRTPGNYLMPDRSFTITGLIAQGGGVAADIRNPQIRLSRGGSLYGVGLETLLRNPGLDTTLRGGDKVYVEQDPRYFLTLGALDKEAQIPFPTEVVTALDAISLAGGVIDTRGDPKGILILRSYEQSQLRQDGTGPDKDRVIFAIDLTNADGLFSAGQFVLQDRDLVLITESTLTTTQTILTLFGNAALIRNRL